MLSKRDLQPGPMQLFLCSSLSTGRHLIWEIFFSHWIGWEGTRGGTVKAVCSPASCITTACWCHPMTLNCCTCSTFSMSNKNISHLAAGCRDSLWNFPWNTSAPSKASSSCGPQPCKCVATGMQVIPFTRVRNWVGTGNALSRYTCGNRSLFR